MKRNIYTILFLLVAFLSFTSSFGTSLLDAGVEHYEKGQYQFAINNLRKFIQFSEDESKKPQAIFYIAVSYYFEKQFEISLNYFDRLTAQYRLSEFHLQTYFWRGLIHQNLGNWVEAEESFSQFLSFLPNAATADRALLAIINAQMKQKKLDEALKNLKEFAKKFPKSDFIEEAVLLRIYLNIGKKNYSEAGAILMPWLLRIEKSKEEIRYEDRFYLYRAEIAFYLGEYTIAKTYYKAIDGMKEARMSKDIALYRLSEIEKADGNYRDSRRYLFRLSNEFPNSSYNTDALLVLASIEFEQKNYDESYALFTEAINTIDTKISGIEDPLRSNRFEKLRLEALFYQGEIHIQQKNYEKAINIYERIIKQDNDYSEKTFLRYFELLLIMKNKDKLDKFVNTYKNSLSKLNSKNPRFVLYMAEYLYITGQYTDALKILDTVKESDEFKKDYLKIASRIYIVKSDYDRALELLREMVTITPLDKKIPVYFEMMKLSFEVMNYDEVISLYHNVQYLIKNNNITEDLGLKVHSTYLIGLAYMQLREYNKSLELLESVQNLSSFSQGDEEVNKIIDMSYYYTGWIYYKISEYQKSASAFNRAASVIENPPLIKDSLYMEGFSYYTAGNYKKSIGIFENIYKTFYPDPMAIKAYYQSGKVYDNLNMLEEQKKIFYDIYYSFPDNNYKILSLFELTRLAFETGDLSKANDYLTEFELKFPDSALLLTLFKLQAEKLLAKQRYSEAYSVYRHIINNNKKSLDDTVFYWAGYTSYKIDNYKDAGDFFTVLIEDFPDSGYRGQAMDYLIEVLRNEDNYTEELSVIKQRLEGLENDRERQKLIARKNEIEYILGGKSSEEAALLQRIDTGDVFAKYELAMYYEKSDKSKTMRLINELVSEKDHIAGSYANNYLGTIEFNNDNYKEALQFFIDTVSNYKTDSSSRAEAFYKMAYSLNRLGNSDRAIEIIERLKKDYPDSEWTEKSVDLLSIIKGGR